MRVLVEGGEMMTLWPHPQVGPGHLHGGEETSRLHNILSTSIIPFDVGGISLLIDGHGHSVDGKLPVLSLDIAVGLAMARVTLEHADHIVEFSEE